MEQVQDKIPVRRLIGVYNGNGTLRGELAYFVGARIGTAHCALCDITHGLVRERRDFQDCRDDLNVAFEFFHRNDQPDAVRVLVGDVAPVVVAETDGGLVLLLGPAELESCESSVDKFIHAIDMALENASLELPGTALVGATVGASEARQ